MAKSISVRKIFKLNIPEGITEITKADVPLGTITKSGKTLSTENGIIFEVLNCSFSKDITESISAYIFELDQYVSLDHFKKKFTFNMYYSSKKGLLFSEAVTPVTKSFLSALKTTPNVDLEYTTEHFDFDKISSQFAQTRGVRFNSSDQGVNNKLFNGNAVNENNEALLAIQNDDATQIIGVINMGNTDYTVSFTQSGTVVVYNKIPHFERKEVPMLEFAVSVFSEIGYIKKD